MLFKHLADRSGGAEVMSENLWEKWAHLGPNGQMCWVWRRGRSSCHGPQGGIPLVHHLSPLHPTCGNISTIRTRHPDPGSLMFDKLPMQLYRGFVLKHFFLHQLPQKPNFYTTLLLKLCTIKHTSLSLSRANPRMYHLWYVNGNKPRSYK